MVILTRGIAHFEQILIDNIDEATLRDVPDDVLFQVAVG
jgi:hypothetical protein